MTDSQSLNITPGMGVYGYFKHINYKSWYALAEFIDNAIQSFETKNGTFDTRNKCLINIKYDPNNSYLSVEDNAYGISEKEHERAFTAGIPPADRSGLSEFGIGMKSAGLWFSPDWTVVTQPIDSHKIFKYNLVEENLKVSDGFLSPEIQEKSSKSGFTRIELRKLHSQLRGNTIKKIKSHLSSIYRCFLKSNLLEIEFNGEKLEYIDPDILNSPPAWDENGQSFEWKKPLSFNLSNGASIKGFVAIREKGSTTQAGFSYFRRKRLIEGSDDEKRRPVEIFGSSNTFPYQRIFGEIHIDGFDVSHTKDSFNFLEYEDELNEKIKEIINSDPLKIIKQANEYRAKKLDEKSKIEMFIATKGITEKLGNENGIINTTFNKNVPENNLVSRLSDAIKGNNHPSITGINPNQSVNEKNDESSELNIQDQKFFKYSIGGVEWNISVSMSELKDSSLYSIEYLDKDSENINSKVKNIRILINSSHKLILDNCNNAPEAINVTQILLLAISTSEIIMTAQGHRFIGLLRQRINELVNNIVKNN